MRLDTLLELRRHHIAIAKALENEIEEERKAELRRRDAAAPEEKSEAAERS